MLWLQLIVTPEYAIDSLNYRIILQQRYHTRFVVVVIADARITNRIYTSDRTAFCHVGWYTDKKSEERGTVDCPGLRRGYPVFTKDIKHQFNGIGYIYLYVRPVSNADRWCLSLKSSKIYFTTAERHGTPLQIPVIVHEFPEISSRRFSFKWRKNLFLTKITTVIIPRK